VFGSNISPRLFITGDAEKLIIALHPLKLSPGRSRRVDWGGIREIIPIPPSPSLPQRKASRNLAIIIAVVIASVATCCFGHIDAYYSLSLVPLYGMLTFVTATLVWGWKDNYGMAVVPWRMRKRRQERHVLASPEERAAFLQSLDVAKRVANTWPELGNMIDIADAEPLLARSLWDLADALVRRQQIRNVRNGLRSQDTVGLPANSPLVLQLQAQRARVHDLWSEINVEVDRHAANLMAAAVAGETFIREQSAHEEKLRAEQKAHQDRLDKERKLHETMLDAERKLGHAIDHVGQALNGLDRSALSSPRDAGEHLAEHTAAVVMAYRELAARYSAR
jgi:hypothetical protein